ncbi:DoxX family protein [candidate division KSB1 bacterium]|nr:DoxX family protein [candidate division KSB1 bacterium]
MELKKILSKEAINKDLGLFILRLGVGLSMAIFHGYGKIFGGPERWERIGGAMGNLGISFLPAFWGFMAAFSEFFCSIFLILGILFRPAALFLACTMFIATLNHLNLPADAPNSGFSGASHAIELMAVYIALLFLGSGKFTVTSKL